MSKLALVTGGAHPMGIGFASARALVKLGFEVIVTGINDAEIALTPEESGISALVLDVTDEAAVQTLMQGLPRLDALVNAAGRAVYGEYEMTTFIRTLEINLSGTMRVALAAHPLLAREGGTIVNVGSIYSIFGSAMTPGYAASKGGVVALTRSLAVAWAKDGVRVNAVAPGWIKTNMSRPMWEDEEASRPAIERTPMGRWGEAQEIGDVVGFLCSRESRFVTGVMIPVDGGYTISG